MDKPMEDILKKMAMMAERNRVRKELEKKAKEAPTCCGGVEVVNGRCPVCGDRL